MPDALISANPTHVVWKVRVARGQPASAAKNATTRPSAAVCSTVSCSNTARGLKSQRWPSTGPASTMAAAWNHARANRNRRRPRQTFSGSEPPEGTNDHARFSNSTTACWLGSGRTLASLRCGFSKEGAAISALAFSAAYELSLRARRIETDQATSESLPGYRGAPRLRRGAPNARGVGAMSGPRSTSEEALAGVGEPVEQRRRRPESVARLLLELEDLVAQGRQADRVGPEHRAAAVDRPAVAVHPDDVDVAGARRHLLLEDLGALVHHRIEQALEDLIVGDRPARDAHLGGDVHDDLLDVGIGRRAPLLVVLVVTGPRLLAEAAELADAVGHRRLHAAALPNAPADVETGEVPHRERTHREAEVVEHAVHLVRQRALEDDLLGLDPALVQHAVTDEAVADADEDRDLVDAAADGHGGGDRRLRRLRPAHVLEQLHHVGGAEEVGADHALGPARGRGDLVGVERGGVRGQHGVGGRGLVGPRGDLLLDRPLLP